MEIVTKTWSGRFLILPSPFLNDRYNILFPPAPHSKMVFHFGFYSWQSLDYCTTKTATRWVKTSVQLSTCTTEWFLTVPNPNYWNRYFYFQTFSRPFPMYLDPFQTHSRFMQHRIIIRGVHCTTLTITIIPYTSLRYCSCCFSERIRDSKRALLYF